jgi:hypothetical protein
MQNIDWIKVGKVLMYLSVFLAAVANVLGADVPVVPTV